MSLKKRTTNSRSPLATAALTLLASVFVISPFVLATSVQGQFNPATANWGKIYSAWNTNKNLTSDQLNFGHDAWCLSSYAICELAWIVENATPKSVVHVHMCDASTFFIQIQVMLPTALSTMLLSERVDL